MDEIWNILTRTTNSNSLFWWLQIEKIVFVVFFSGEQAKTKILKICDAFGASCYPVPEDSIKKRQIIREVLCFNHLDIMNHLFYI